MLLCDRCGKEIKHITNSEHYEHKSVTIYRAQGAYIGYYVDLCSECDKNMKDFIGKAESYFMVNKENPFDIFNNARYWE